MEKKIFVSFYFRAILVSRKMRENFHPAKISTFNSKSLTDVEESLVGKVGQRLKLHEE